MHCAKIGYLDQIGWAPYLVIHRLITTNGTDAKPVARASWDKVCFYVTPIGEDGSEERKNSDLFLSHLIEPVCVVGSHALSKKSRRG
jgi:hypothetical protein